MARIDTRGTLIDANVLLDVTMEGSEWLDWSAAMLAEAGHHGALYINPIIYAEVAYGFDHIDELDEALPPAHYRRAELPWPAAFVAAKAFVKYRRAGGARRAPLPDFYIGAHAAVSGLTLLTRDARRYREYFPTVRIVAP